MIKATQLWAWSVRAMMTVVAILCAGCIAAGPTLAPFYTEQTLSPVNDLVGVWQFSTLGTSGPTPPTGAPVDPKLGTMIIVPRGHAKYQVTFEPPEDMPDAERKAQPLSGGLDVTTFKLGNALFADLIISEKERVRLSEQYPGLIVFTHFVAKIEVAKDELRVHVMQIEPNDLIKRQKSAEKWRNAEFGMPPEKKSGGIVLDFPMRLGIADTEDLQRDLVTNDAKGVFESGNVLLYKRVKPN